MTVLMTNVYLMRDGECITQMFTGLIGAFDTKEKAMEVWSGKLRELGVPELEQMNYMPDVAGRTEIEVSNTGRYTEEHEGYYYLVELMSCETEMNKVLGLGDSTILKYEA